MKNKRLIINIISSIIVFTVQLMISFWLSPFIVRRLGEEANGYISLVNNFIQYMSLITIAINSMSSRYISIEYNKGNIKEANKYFSTVYWANVIISIVVAIASSIMVIYLEHIINISNGLIMDVKLTFALGFMNLLFTFWGTVYTVSAFATNRMDLNSYRQIAANVIKSIIIIFAFVMFPPHIFYVSLAILVAGIYVFFSNRRLTKKLTPELHVSLQDVQKLKLLILLKSGIWLLISNLSNILINGFDLLIANEFIKPAAMGRLSMAKQIPMALGTLLSFFSNIFCAAFTELVALGKKDRLIKEVDNTMKILAWLLTVPFSGIIIFGMDFLKLWLPTNVYSSNDVKQVYYLMLFDLAIVIINAYMYSIHALFIALDKVKGYSIIILISGSISFVTTLILVAKTSLGVFAIAGTSTVILGITDAILIPIYAARVMNIKSRLLFLRIGKSVSMLVINSLLFFIIKPLLPLDSWVKLGVSVVIVGIIAYIFDFAFMLNKDEKSIIITKIKKHL